MNKTRETNKRARVSRLAVQLTKRLSNRLMIVRANREQDDFSFKFIKHPSEVVEYSSLMISSDNVQWIIPIDRPLNGY